MIMSTKWQKSLVRDVNNDTTLNYKKSFTYEALFIILKDIFRNAQRKYKLGSNAFCANDVDMLSVRLN